MTYCFRRGNKEPHRIRIKGLVSVQAHLVASQSAAHLIGRVAWLKQFLAGIIREQLPEPVQVSH